jgi:hypothetical protein
MTDKAAFLFYSQDFLFGTLALPMEDRGKYITLLCYMHSHGRLNEETVKQLAGEISVQLRSKFKVDENGNWYNQRLETELKKRERFVKSRRNNGERGGRPQKEQATLFDNVTETVAGKIPPASADVKLCFMARGLAAIEAEYETLKFMAHYTATGWRTARGGRIVNWKAALTDWLIHRNQFLQHNKQSKTLTEQWLA